MWKKTKLKKLVDHMNACEWEEALRLASTFSELGKQKNLIMKAAQAVKNPRFSKQIGVDVELAIKDGIEALKEKYEKYSDYDEFMESVKKERLEEAIKKEEKRQTENKRSTEEG
jgi:ADP-dependent phosphofructokinase/glucokinase